MKQVPCSTAFASTKLLIHFHCCFVECQKGKRKKREKGLQWVAFLKRSEADKLFCCLAMFKLTSSSKSFHAFPCRVTRENSACPHIIFVQKEGKNKSKEHRAGAFALCSLFWSCHTNLPCVGNFLFPGDLGKKWSRMEQPKPHPLCACFFGDLLFFPSLVVFRMIVFFSYCVLRLS